MANNNQLATMAIKDMTPEQKFTALVQKKMKAKLGNDLELSEYQLRLMQNYYIEADRAITAAEEARLRKKKNQDKVAVTWQNINMERMAMDVVHYSRLGLDPCEKNNLFLIPFKNNKTEKYDMNFMPGYVGLELITKKYAQDLPVVTVELVHANDSFTVIKKGVQNKCDSYDFEINNPFNRGEVIGGFAYLQYENPEKNKLIVMTMKDIKKRKGAGQGNVEFWGGSKPVWENGNKTDKITEVEGWFEEMCLKTIKRHVYGGNIIPLDPRLIDETYNYIKQREQDLERAAVEAEIAENANTIVVEDYEVDPITGEVISEPAEGETHQEAPPVAEPEPQESPEYYDQIPVADEPDY